jgi:hypothetical protein
VTIVTSPPEQPKIDEAYLLFKEARQRRRRRWLVAGVATVVATAVVIIVGVITDARQPVRPPASRAPNAPVGPTRTVSGATVVPKVAWVDNEGQLHIGDISGFTQRVVAQADADPQVPLVATAGRIFWVRPRQRNLNVTTTSIDSEVYGFDTATGRSGLVAPGIQVIASVDRTFLYVETDDRHLIEYWPDGTPKGETLQVPIGWFLPSPGLFGDPTPVIANGILVVSLAYSNTPGQPNTGNPDFGTLAIWNPSTGHVRTLGPALQVTATYTRPGGRSSLIAWRPGSCLSTSSCPIEITNTADYSSRLVNSPTTTFGWGGAFSPDGSRLAVFIYSDDGRLDPTSRLAIMNVRSGDVNLVKGAFVYIGESVRWVQWLPDGSHLITGGLARPGTAPPLDVVVNSQTMQVSPFRFSADSNQDLTISTIIVK